MQLLSWHKTLHRLNTSLIQRTIQLCNCYHGTQPEHRLNISLVQRAIKLCNCYHGTQHYTVKYITCTKNYSIMQLLSWHTTLHRLNTLLVQRTIQLCNCYHGTQHYTV